ncbi:hypothetical protein DLJ96_04585, partial [Actinotalea fermentans ATCC 43279 = JCM 9966 = DSM 3133]
MVVMTSGPDDVTPLGRVGAPHGSRRPTLSSRLRRIGFADVTRSASLLDDKDLVGVVGPLPEDVLVALGVTADPDLALLQLARLSSAVAGDEASCRTFRDLLTGAGERDAAEAVEGEAPVPSGRDRLLAVLGASVAL